MCFHLLLWTKTAWGFWILTLCLNLPSKASWTERMLLVSMSVPPILSPWHRITYLLLCLRSASHYLCFGISGKFIAHWRLAKLQSQYTHQVEEICNFSCKPCVTPLSVAKDECVGQSVTIIINNNSHFNNVTAATHWIARVAAATVLWWYVLHMPTSPLYGHCLFVHETLGCVQAFHLMCQPSLTKW